MVNNVRYNAAKEILDLLPLKYGSLLDIGCGTGELVLNAQCKGYVAIGIDKNKQTVSTLGCFHADIFNFGCREFDIITLNHILEHFADPDSLLQEAFKRLKPVGYLVVAVPNIDSWLACLLGQRWYGWSEDVEGRHESMFTPGSLAYLLTKNGFCVRRIVTKNMHHSFPINLIGWIGSLFGKGDNLIILAKRREG